MEQELRVKAEQQAQLARSQASSDRMQLEEERAARVRGHAVATTSAAAPVTPGPAVVVERSASTATDTEKTETRVRLLQELSRVVSTRDTPRGLVVTLPEPEFQSTSLSSGLSARLARLASIVATQPGLFVTVEGNSDVANGERMAFERTMAVRESLVRSGIPADRLAREVLE